MNGGGRGTLANPAVRAILGSRFHGVLSRSLVLLTVTGRRTRRRHTIPVMYAEDGDAIIVLAGQPARKRWWRNLRGGAPVALRIRGKTREGLGEIVDDPAAIAAATRRYLAKFPRAARALDAAERPVVVRIRLGGERVRLVGAGDGARTEGTP